MLHKRHISTISRPVVRFIKFRILHVDDSPRNLAMGVAIGLFIAWTPTIGLQMLIAIALAVLLRANKFLSITLVWVSNIFTLVPIYLPSFLLGKRIVDVLEIGYTSSKHQAMQLLERLSSFSVLTDMWTLDFWKSVIKIMIDIGLPLWIGTMLIAPIIAVASYLVTYRMINWYRHKNPRRRYRKHLLESS